QVVGVGCQLGAGRDGRVPSLDALRLELAARARLLPALHRRLAGTGRLGWITDTDLDMDRQVGEWVLSTDSGSPEARLEMAMTAVGRFWSQRLPRDRPAFQVQLIRAEHGPLREGATGSPAVAALVAFKMHHAVADGISALSLLDRLLTRPSGLDRASSSGPTSESGSAASTARAAVTGLVSLAAQGLAPPQPLSRPPSRDRQVVGWTVSLAEVTARSSALGVRRHEFVLGLIAEALGRLLRPAALVRDGSSLRAMVPVAIRPARLDRFFGNWTGTLAVDLPVEPMPFSTRVDLLAREMRTRASRGEPLASHLVLRAAGRLPRRLFAAAARAVYGARFFHTIVSYLPGPREERFLAGARVGAIYPVLPLAPGVPITVATVTFDSTLGVGVTVDSGLGVDPDTVRAAWDQAWAATDGQPAGAPVSAAPTGS
ncbi:MAG: WS/DGAT domain-containing protein, partial [Microlunatus sp.]|nr:WS/DGAT domain-containing protein [Microlunatus sp.]